MPRQWSVQMAAVPSPACIALGALLLASVAALSGCSATTGNAAPHVEPEWRLVPEGTVLGQRRQFFLYGRHLESVLVSAPASVTIQKGEVKPGGRALSLYLTVIAASRDSPARGEAPGWREIEARMPDTALTFRLKILDETPQR